MLDVRLVACWDAHIIRTAAWSIYQTPTHFRKSKVWWSIKGAGSNASSRNGWIWSSGTWNVWRENYFDIDCSGSYKNWRGFITWFRPDKTSEKAFYWLHETSFLRLSLGLYTHPYERVYRLRGVPSAVLHTLQKTRLLELLNRTARLNRVYFHISSPPIQT